MIFSCNAPSRPSTRLVGPLLVLVAGLASAGLAQAANCSDAPVSGQQYYIVNEGSGLQLDVAGGSSNDGTAVIQWTAGTQPNQQWLLTDLGGNHWTMRAVHSGKGLDDAQWNPADGAAVEQWSYSGNRNQQWALSRATNGAYSVTSYVSNLVLTVSDARPGTPLKQRQNQGGAQQLWRFNPVNGVCGNTATTRTFMGSDKILIGATMEDTSPVLPASSADQAPYDARYSYIASPMSNSDSCQSKPVKDCGDARVDQNGNSLPGSDCNGWWGCWQYPLNLPGDYVKGKFSSDAAATWQGKSKPRITVLTYYMMKTTMGGEGDPSLNGISDVNKLRRYLNDWRFLLKLIGTRRVMLHIEPDFWGFVRGRAMTVPLNQMHAQVKAAAGSDCLSQPDDVTGLSRCMIAMARTYAPNAAVGLHVSPWHYSEAGDAAASAKFMLALGADQGDFVANDPTDRDAGWYALSRNGRRDTTWNDTRFKTYMGWVKAISETVGKPAVLWQIPLGNSSSKSKESDFHYSDDKVEYLFSRINEVAQAHVVALLFGNGDGVQTNAQSDGGYLANWTRTIYNKGGVKIVPAR